MPSRRRTKTKKPARPAVSRRRLWLFRVCAVLFVPLILIGGLELGLRVADYGYPTSFFLRTKIDGKDFFVPNDCFGFRFFPKAIARTPFPLRMPAQKPTNAYRIFLFGESAAQGDPDPTFGAGRYLEILLRERFPGTDFKVICTAMTAINSHAILPIARECAGRDGDLWIIYMGNNEMVGPYGAGTVFGPQAPGVALVRASLFAKSTRIGQLMENLMGKIGKNPNGPKSWGGLGMFEKNQLRPDDSRRLRAYENFQKNLEDILSAAHRARVPVLLSTVVSNLKDCAPFGSMHDPALDDGQKFQWEKIYNAGIASETNGDFQAALNLYSKAAALDSQFADLQFRMARCELALTNIAGALRDFELARDDDTLAFRADSRINGIISKTAARHSGSGVYFVDAVQSLATNSPDGIPGHDIFYEHVHLNFHGNYLLARLFAEKIAPLLPASITSHGKTSWASARVCDQHLAVSPWDRYRVWQANYSRVSEPPFTAQLNDVSRAKFYIAKLKELDSQMTDAARETARTLYQQALAARPDDPSLHGNFAQLLGEFGDLGKAAEEEQRVCDLLPQSAAAHHKKGVLLAREGKISDAAAEFSRTLSIRPDYVPSLNELGLIYANQQKNAEAGNCFTNAIRLNPGYAESYLNLGFLEQGAGNFDQAMAHYKDAANLQTGGPAAYFYHAVTSAAEHRRDEAVKLFQTAVWMNPNFWQARYLLGVELASEEKVADAEAQFLQVTLLRPDFAKAHLNLGVALAKQRKLDAAAIQFRAVLNMEPDNNSARRNLETLEQLKNRIQRK